MTTILENRTNDDPSNGSNPMGFRAAAVLVAKTTAHRRRARFAVLPLLTNAACEKQRGPTKERLSPNNRRRPVWSGVRTLRTTTVRDGRRVETLGERRPRLDDRRDADRVLDWALSGSDRDSDAPPQRGLPIRMADGRSLLLKRSQRDKHLYGTNSPAGRNA